jgi:hypothetical protein
MVGPIREISMTEDKTSGLGAREPASSGVEWRRDWQADCATLATGVHPRKSFLAVPATTPP